MEFRLEDYEEVIKTLVWKFRNLGFIDVLYAPTIHTSTEARADNRMDRVEEGSEKRRNFRYRAKYFEDLISEGYVVFTELKNQFESMGIYCDNCKDKCPFYFQMQRINFEQALVVRLESRFTTLHQDLHRQKRSADIRPINEEDENISYDFTPSLEEKLKQRLAEGSIAKNLEPLVRGILNNEIESGAQGRITKESIIKYLRKIGWSKQKSERFLYSFPV